MSRQEMLKKAGAQIQEYCDDHTDCKSCALEPLCNILPRSLSEWLTLTAKNKETRIK